MNYYLDVLKKYAVFNGRVRRKEYWMFALWNFIVGFALEMLSFIIIFVTKNPLPLVLVVIYGLAVLLPSLGVYVRRLHDTNHNAWWILINLIPLFGAIVSLVFLATDSVPGDNKYGPNPKGIPAAVH